MRILVCIKQVPVTGEVQFDAVTHRIVREGVGCVVNAYDRRAMTEAARLKDVHGGEVVALTMGPPQASEALVECLAMGADRAVHLCDRAFAGADTLATARTLAAAVRREGPFDLIFCGRASTDADTGQVGPELAELLGLPQATGVTKIILDPSDRALTATCETDEGFDVVRVPLPALVTAAERLCKPLRVDDAMLATGHEKPIAVVTATDLAGEPSQYGGAGSPTSVAEIRSASVERSGVIVAGASAEESAERLVAHLVERGLFRGWNRSALPAAPSGLAGGSRDDRAVWTIAEVGPGSRLRRVSYELLGRGAALARRLDGVLGVVLIGHHLDRYVDDLRAHGADRIYTVDHPDLAEYSTDGFVAALTELVDRLRPYVVLVPATTRGRDFAPRMAARLGLGLTGDCIGLDVDDRDRLAQLKPAFGGNVIAPISSRTLPQLATVRPGVLDPFAPNPVRHAIVERMPYTPVPIRRKLISRMVDVDPAAVALQEADVVVCVGTGIGGPENLQPIRDLAAALGAAIGGTRKVVDQGWLPRQQQIGVTGKTVAPRLYIGVGVRGLTNHAVGMQKSGIVAAINKDPNAEIFRMADYGLVGDWAEIVPALTRSTMSVAR